MWKHKIIDKFCLVFIFFPLFLFANGVVIDRNFDAAFNSRSDIRDEQPKMIFIIPWQSKVDLDLSVNNSLNGYFDFLLNPKSQNDLDFELKIISKQLK